MSGRRSFATLPVEVPGSTGDSGGGSSAAGSTFVFRPGGVTLGNVYATWPALYAALNIAAPVSAEGNRPPTIVQIDDFIVSPAVIPAGAYNLDSVTVHRHRQF